MLQRLAKDLRTRAGSAVRLAALAIAIAIALFLTIGFLTAAIFMFVLPREGAVAACFAAGAVFFIIALLAAAAYAVSKRQDERRLEQAAKEAAQSAKSTASTLLSDPAALTIGLQLVRLIGVRRLIPLLAIGGIALGLLASQRDRRGEDGSSDDDSTD
jgi:hypothetical protein